VFERRQIPGKEERDTTNLVKRKGNLGIGGGKIFRWKNQERAKRKGHKPEKRIKGEGVTAHSVMRRKSELKKMKKKQLTFNSLLREVQSS